MNRRGVADAGSFVGAIAATGLAAVLARACPSGCATCGTCAVTVLPTVALVGSVGIAALGSKLTRRLPAGDNATGDAHVRSRDA